MVGRRIPKVGEYIFHKGNGNEGGRPEKRRLNSLTRLGVERGRLRDGEGEKRNGKRVP